MLVVTPWMRHDSAISTESATKNSADHHPAYSSPIFTVPSCHTYGFQHTSATIRWACDTMRLHPINRFAIRCKEKHLNIMHAHRPLRVNTESNLQAVPHQDAPKCNCQNSVLLVPSIPGAGLHVISQCSRSVVYENAQSGPFPTRSRIRKALQRYILARQKDEEGI